jgi:hypothetical protein
MLAMEPYNVTPHAIVTDTGQSLQIVLRTPRSWWELAQLGFGPLVLSLFGSVFIRAFLEPGFERGRVLALLIAALIGLFFLTAIVGFFINASWYLVGCEILEVSSISISVQQRLFGLSRTHEFFAGDIKRLRVSQRLISLQERMASILSLFDLATLSQSPLAFDYGAKTYRFGNNVDEGEARQIVALIHQRFPQYR